MISNGSFTRKDNAHLVALTFLCKYKSGDPIAGDETTDAAWMSYEEIVVKCHPITVKYLDNVPKQDFVKALSG